MASGHFAGGRIQHLPRRSRQFPCRRTAYLFQKRAAPGAQGGVFVTRSRADRLLVERGLAQSRTRAQELILAGRVTVDGARLDKASALVDSRAVVQVSDERDFVSRGGKKLDPVLDVLGAELEGSVVVDVGASTG